MNEDLRGLRERTCTILRMFAIVPRMPFARSMGTRSLVTLMADIVAPNNWITLSSCGSLDSENCLSLESSYVRVG
jgi:hypothetical protein